MKKKVAISGMLALVMTAGVLLTLLPTAGAGQTLHYQLGFRTGEFNDVDVNDNGSHDDPGDFEIGEFALKKSGKVVGHFDFQCVNVSTGPPRQLCWAGARIEGKGTLIVADVERSGDTPTAVVAITGGTGAFRGATGIARLGFRDGTVTFEVD